MADHYFPQSLTLLSIVIALTGVKFAPGKLQLVSNHKSLNQSHKDQRILLDQGPVLQTLIFKKNALYFDLKLDFQRSKFLQPWSFNYRSLQVMHITRRKPSMSAMEGFSCVRKISYNPPQSAARLLAQEFRFDNSIPHFFACHAGVQQLDTRVC